MEFFPELFRDVTRFESMAQVPGPDDILLLEGCYLEAQRSDDIWLKLEGLRTTIQQPSHSDLAMTIGEIRSGARFLRQLGDVAQVHRDRVQFVLNHLNTLLPSLSRSLRDIKDHYDDRSRTPERRWQDMHYILTREARGVPIPNRSFDQDQLSLTVYQNSQNNCAYLLLRILRDDKPWFALRGAHRLCVERDGSSLRLMRWSVSQNASKSWAILFFRSWEELVLMYCTIISLKAHNNLTRQFCAEELGLQGERKLFQARIWDDSFHHSLILYEETASRNLRIHSAVWDGPLRQCPCVDQYKVHLMGVQLHVFSQTYREQSQRRGPPAAAAFEIEFLDQGAAHCFQELFHHRA
ncbi:hypothetical protein E4U41_002406 [Claviceps citrina]|nr:hypothetical protein E4U41_002406 [Claviceps citrina]